MLDFLAGCFLGHVLTEKKEGFTAEQVQEHVQTRLLACVVESACETEQTAPSPEILALQLKPLKRVFDRIELAAIRSQDALTVYRQMQEYFEEHAEEGE